MDEPNPIGASGEVEYCYSIRLLLTHPTMRGSEITGALGMEPEYSWDIGQGGHKHTMWGHVSWTQGRRLFFDEVHDVLEWLQKEQKFISQFLSSGGQLQVIVQLPGSINIGSTLKLETMTLASKLGVTIGVEVFPKLPGLNRGAGRPAISGDPGIPK
jgi:hypothetical protein